VGQKCTFCAHLLDEGWKIPRCVQACPTDALRAVHGDDEEMAKIVQDEGLEVLHPELKTKPRVYYKSLYRFERCFVGGSVAVEKNGVTDCKGATVTFRNSSGKVGDDDEASATSGGQPGGGQREIHLEIRHSVHGNKEMDVEVKKSLTLGTISL
jgi:hypothetical protein